MVGWVTIRRASYGCPACGHGHCPLDTTLGLHRDSHSPGVRRLACRLGALLPYAEAATTVAETVRVQLSANTVRTVTEAVGARWEQRVAAEIATVWTRAVPPAGGPRPERLDVVMAGVRILGIDGTGREVTPGMVVPVAKTGASERRDTVSYVAGLEPAAFGPRLVLEAHRRGIEGGPQIAIPGDGAEWIWTLAAEHCPTAIPIADWFHASEHIWGLGRALSGAETGETEAWGRSTWPASGRRWPGAARRPPSGMRR